MCGIQNKRDGGLHVHICLFQDFIKTDAAMHRAGRQDEEMVLFFLLHWLSHVVISSQRNMGAHTSNLDTIYMYLLTVNTHHYGNLQFHVSVQFNHFNRAHWVAVRCEASRSYLYIYIYDF